MDELFVGCCRGRSMLESRGIEFLVALINCDMSHQKADTKRKKVDASCHKEM